MNQGKNNTVSIKALSERKVQLFVFLIASLFVLSAFQVFPVFANVDASCKPNVTLRVFPTSSTVQAGSSAHFFIGASADCGYTGTINVFASISRTVSNEPTLHLGPYDLCCGGGSAGLGVGTVRGTPTTTYTITITAHTITCPLCISKSISQSASVTLTVCAACAPSPGFAIAANPTKITVPAGQTANSAITATGQNGFTGTIYYSTVISGGFCSTSTYCSDSCNISPWNPTLSSTVTSVTSILSCSFATKGTYTIVVTGTAIYFSLPSRTATITITVT
jgi:hypothetical protein